MSEEVQIVYVKSVGPASQRRGSQQQAEASCDSWSEEVLRKTELAEVAYRSQKESPSAVADSDHDDQQALRDVQVLESDDLLLACAESDVLEDDKASDDASPPRKEVMLGKRGTHDEEEEEEEKERAEEALVVEQPADAPQESTKKRRFSSHLATYIYENRATIYTASEALAATVKDHVVSKLGL
jgi:hypothetical protein